MLSICNYVKSVQIRSFFWSAFSRFGPEKTPYLDIFHEVTSSGTRSHYFEFMNKTSPILRNVCVLLDLVQVAF